MKKDIKLFYFLSCSILILASIIIFCYIIKDLKITNDSVKKDINIQDINYIEIYKYQLDSLSLEIFKCKQNINAAKIDIKMNTPVTPETDEYQLELTKKLKLDEELRLIELNNKKDSIEILLNKLLK